ncbi:exodeoxyribonuclease VII large subunit [Cricetibacter osteomyelitidis]|uniref:Exodeoxyribonuclease 7 large subunit n=1 Tax=Cricetibacter osteomyelitidis TaxID=1521931 RepID=A0A4R2SUE3_9PAST|nr:exodeoxyribonuclease VII large subunit [Cricetibacter osteomyelitidis]TCP92106.1 exodeoxyribonuclease VII large subunit [Cricetibacter osteomyelitidis]
MENNHIYSVTQLNQTAKMLLESKLGLVWLTGEISNFTQPVSGHWYLTLKDENSQVRCAMFRTKNLRVSFRPQNGMQVLVRASVSLYEPRGDYQLIIESIHPAGEGLLQQQFEALKMKLAAEGLFAQHLKKNLPHFARKVGIVTSQTGAALQDILHILQRRDPSLSVIIYPTAVQGKDATAEIVRMIELANTRQEVDVLIVGRGGGSLEDLWCFNEEAVARAIFNSVIPIISAVGHEIDVTIADFVADLRAPTPSAAAELVSRDQAELHKQLQYKKERLEMALDRLLTHKQQQLQRLALRLQNQHPQNRLHHQQQRMTQLEIRFKQAMRRLIEKKSYNLTALSARLKQNPLPYRMQKQHQHLQQLEVRLNFAINKIVADRQNRLANLCGKLDSLSPLKVLARGYSIVKNEQGQTVTDIHQIQVGEQITTKLTNGQFISKIDKILS